MKKIYDAVCIIGTYKDKSGKDKPRYLNVGAVLEGDKGVSLKLDALPAHGFTGWINFYEPKERQQKSGDGGNFEEDQDVPF